MLLSTVFVLACAAGVTAHIGLFIRGEWHMQAPVVLVIHVLLAALVVLYDFRDMEMSPSSFSNAFGIISGYLLGLFSSIIAYRLSPFHRLHSFPGPRLAALTKLWHVWQCRDSRNHELMERLHEEYGDFARLGPGELAAFHPESYTVLEGYGTQCRKSDFYDLLLPDFSLVFTREKRVHDARRNVWSRELSTQAIASYRDRMNRQVGVLMKNTSESATMKRPVVINEVMYWFAFDSMGEFAFNQDFGMMRRQEWHFAVTLFRRALSIVGPFAPTIWLIKVGFTFLPWFWKIGDWFKMLAFCNQQMLNRMKTRPEEKDISSFFLDEADKEGHSESMQNWLKGDTATVIVAGSDTTAPSLTFLSYLLAKHPEHAEKIHAELAVVDPLDLNAISVLPHLNGTINEAMRLYPVATTVVSRETPPKGIMIGDTFIPGNTKVLAPRWVIFRLESCFERAMEFIPERWYSRPEMVKNKHVFSPFGMGRASCVGQGLATAQLRLVVASLVKKFHLRFLPGEDGKEVVRDMRDQLTAQPGRLRLMFELRE